MNRAKKNTSRSWKNSHSYTLSKASITKLEKTLIKFQTFLKEMTKPVKEQQKIVQKLIYPTVRSRKRLQRASRVSRTQAQASG